MTIFTIFRRFFTYFIFPFIMDESSQKNVDGESLIAVLDSRVQEFLNNLNFNRYFETFSSKFCSNLTDY